MTIYVPAKINDTYDIVLPDFREEFHRIRPRWEKGRLEHCARNICPGMTVIDCGAEVGDFTTLYKLWTEPYGHVIPVEPAEHQWPFIRGTLEANGFTDPPIISWPGFVGDISAGRRITHNNTWPAVAYDEGVPDGGFFHLAQDNRHSRITLDDLCVFNAVHPDVIVIDVEGAEGKVLEGCQNTLANDKPTVYVSWHEETAWNWYQTKLEDLHQIMGQFGYSAEELPHFGEGEKFWYYSPNA